MKRRVTGITAIMAGGLLALGLAACRPAGRDYTPPVAPSTLSVDVPWCADIKDSDVRACVSPVKNDERAWRLYQARPAAGGSGSRGAATIVNVCGGAVTLPCITLRNADAPRHAIRYVTVYYNADTSPFGDNGN